MRQQRRQQEALAGLSELVQEDLSGIGAIKIYGQEAAELSAFQDRNRSYRDSAIALGRTRSTLFPLLEGISQISLLLLIALGSGKLATGDLTPGGLIALILYIQLLVFPTALLGFTLNTFQVGQVSLNGWNSSCSDSLKSPTTTRSRGCIMLQPCKDAWRHGAQRSLRRCRTGHINLNFTIEAGELLWPLAAEKPRSPELLDA